ncbi:GNAT family N-acetyltransferase [Propionicimonas sp.]|uniref:GNAT family N-acetyltransferase n=1 Tax=Propionicimonas sp. TaxID=1955623 RepID=UPI0039E52EAB
MLKPDYSFSTDTSEVDRVLVHRWLSEQAYWALGRTREVQDAAIDASRNYSVHDSGSGRQVAYARVITDASTFAWLCDVFVSPQVRGDGIGKLLIEGVVADLDALGVRRTLLATADAHGLYARYGFEPLAEPGRWMGRGGLLPSASPAPQLR